MAFILLRDLSWSLMLSKLSSLNVDGIYFPSKNTFHLEKVSQHPLALP